MSALVSSEVVGFAPSIWLGRVLTSTGEDSHQTERLLTSLKGAQVVNRKTQDLTFSKCAINSCAEWNRHVLRWPWWHWLNMCFNLRKCSFLSFPKVYAIVWYRRLIGWKMLYFMTRQLIKMVCISWGMEVTLLLKIYQEKNSCSKINTPLFFSFSKQEKDSPTFASKIKAALMRIYAFLSVPDGSISNASLPNCTPVLSLIFSLRLLNKQVTQQEVEL